MPTRKRVLVGIHDNPTLDQRTASPSIACSAIDQRLLDCIAVALARGLQNNSALERLNLHGCESLGSLPPIGALRRLRELDLGGCRSLRALPDGLEALSLTFLRLSLSFFFLSLSLSLSRAKQSAQAHTSVPSSLLYEGIQ